MTGKATSFIVHKMAKAGAVAIGIVYATVGIVAILSLLQLKHGGATEEGVLNYIKNIPFGKVFLALIFFALLAYIFWKFYNAITDPYGYGKNFKGIIKRSGVAAAGIAYGFIALSAGEAFLGLTHNTHGQPYEKRLFISKVLEWSAGEWLIAGLGILIAITAIAQFIYVFKLGYKEKFEVKKMSRLNNILVTIAAWLGHFARGIILFIIAWFLFKTSLESDASEMVNTDKAFNFLGEQVGHGAFVFVAAGTIMYGFYMFALSYHYDFEDDYK